MQLHIGNNSNIGNLLLDFNSRTPRNSSQTTSMVSKCETAMKTHHVFVSVCVFDKNSRSPSPSANGFGGSSFSDMQRKNMNEYNRSIKTNQPWNVQQTSQIDVVQHCDRTSPNVKDLRDSWNLFI